VDASPSTVPLHTQLNHLPVLHQYSISVFLSNQMDSITNVPQTAAVERPYLVKLEDYGLKPQLSVKQKLSPLDLNMPRLYGSRWILCFPLPVGISKSVV
jgi:hypothetical protein